MTNHFLFYTVERHGEVYKIWRRQKLKDEILVHVDSHADTARLPYSAQQYRDEPEQIRGSMVVAEFVWLGASEGMFSEVWWVASEIQLKKLSPAYFAAFEGNLKPYCRCQVTTLDGLPKLQVPVILDVDADFLGMQHLFTTAQVAVEALKKKLAPKLITFSRSENMLATKELKEEAKKFEEQLKLAFINGRDKEQ